jgi:hypothetical protein
MGTASRVIGRSMFRNVSGVLPLVLVAGLAGSGCKSTGAAADDSGVVGDAEFVNCATQTLAPPFHEGMQVTSLTGAYLLKVLKNTFTDANGAVLTVEPTKGIDVWTIEIDAASAGTPVDGMSIAVRPYMPQHFHGTTGVGVTPAGGGTYTIAPLNLYMAGYWEITFTLTDMSGDAPVTDSAMVPICISD